MTTWLDVPDDHPFGIDTLPYGVFSTAEAPDRRRVGVRIGDHVLDASAVAALGGDPGDGPHLAAAWANPSLNAFIALGRPAWTIAREWLTEILARRRAPGRGRAAPAPARRRDAAPADRGRRLRRLLRERAPRAQRRADLPPRQPRAAAELEAPADRLPRPGGHRRRVGHRRRATQRTAQGTAGRRAGLRPEHPARHRGRARLRRRGCHDDRLTRERRRGRRPPLRCRRSSTTGAPATSRRGSTCPLGPFLGKSFATSISAWVTPLDALRDARISLPGQADPPILPYLQGDAFGLDVHVEVSLNGTVVSRPEHAGMYWSPAQMLAHLTVNGASVRDGDLFGSGTISGPTQGLPREPARADVERHRAAVAARRIDPRLPRGRRHRDDDGVGAGPGRRRASASARSPARSCPPPPRGCRLTGDASVCRQAGSTSPSHDQRATVMPSGTWSLEPWNALIRECVAQAK